MRSLTSQLAEIQRLRKQADAHRELAKNDRLTDNRRSAELDKAHDLDRRINRLEQQAFSI